jgi:hypothetical protein
MSTHDDELARLLEDGLTREASRVAGAPISLEDVRGRARRIRRRRSALAVGGAAAVVALMVPLGLVLGGALTSSEEPPVVDSPSVTRAEDPDEALPTPSVTGEAGLVVDGLSTGAPPATGYLDEGVFVGPDGEELPSPAADAGIEGALQGRVDLADGTVVELLDVGSDDPTVVVSTAGETYGPFPGRAPAVNEDRTSVAWVADDGAVVAWDTGSTEPVTLGTPPGRPEELVALTGGPCSDACVAYGNGSRPGSWEPLAWAVATGDQEPLDLSGLVVVTAVHDRTVAGYVSIADVGADPGTCTEVRVDGRTTAESCEVTYDAFAPGGGALRTSNAAKDGIGDGLVGFAQADGSPALALVGWEGAETFYSEAVWEDSSHVLLTAYSWDTGTWSVVRLGLDGSLEYAVPPREAQDMDFPFALPVVP